MVGLDAFAAMARCVRRHVCPVHGIGLVQDEEGDWRCSQCNSAWFVVQDQTTGEETVVVQSFPRLSLPLPRCPLDETDLMQDAEGDWRCPQCNSAWADTGSGPDLDRSK